MSEVPRLAGGLSPPIELLARYLFGGDHYMKHCIVPGWAAAYHLGSHYCRPINTPSGPGSTYSQHAFGLGNALDIGLPNNDEGHRVGDAIAAFCRARPNLFSQVLWRGVPLHFPHHVHVSGNPMGSGLPECKGGPKCPIKPALSLSALGVEEDEDVANAADIAQWSADVAEAASRKTKGTLKTTGGKPWTGPIPDGGPKGFEEFEDEEKKGTASKYKGLFAALGRARAADG